MKFKLAKTMYIPLILLAALLLAGFGQSVIMVAAQTDVATVIVLPTTGGTTDPAAGTYTYANGTDIILTATASPGYTFQYWIASGDLTSGHTQGQVPIVIDPETGEPIAPVPPRPSLSSIDSLVFTTNPATIKCGYGYTYAYQAVFAQTTGNATTETEATVIVMPTTGGTVSPAPGMYTYSNGSKIMLTAIPDSGYAFHYWVISGNATPGHGAAGYTTIADENGQIIAQFPRPDTSGIDTLTAATNSLDITCGYGYTYTYTAVFTPASATPTPTQMATSTPATTATPAATASPQATATPIAASGTDMTLWIVVIAVVIIIVIVVVAAVLMRRKK